MDKFDFWTTLIAGLLLFTGGISGIVNDKKKNSAWWRWLLDGLSILIGAWLLLALFIL